MEKRKLTKAQLEDEIQNAIMYIPKDKDTKSVYFDDKGLRLTVTKDYAIIETIAHRHVFNSVTAQGFSRPYLYTSIFIDLALSNDCTVKDKEGNTNRSYSKLLTLLKDKENEREYNLAWFIDMWFFNIFNPLYSIDETELSSFIVLENYIHSISTQQYLLSEHKEDITNKQFVDAILKQEKQLFKDVDEYIVIRKKTDKEKAEDVANALQETLLQKNLSDVKKDKQYEE